jgi:uroporphyrinogen decarboxylase
LIVPHLIGREFFFDEKKGPITEKISCEEDLNLLSLENFHKKASNIYDSVREIRNILPKDKSLIVFTASIWTLIYYIIRDNTDDITQDYKFYKTIYEKPQWLVRLIHLLKEVSVEYIEKLIDSGADIVKIFDTHASQIPDEVLLSYCFEQHLEIMRRVKKKQPKTPFICFPKGIGVRYHEYVKKINPDILAIEKINHYIYS